MPTGAMHRIDRQLGAVVNPVTEFCSWTGTFIDMQGGRPPVADPSVAREG